MARRGRQTAPMNAGTAGWGAQVLGILFVVFTLAIVFGVLLIAAVVTNNTLAQTAGANNTLGTTGTTPLQVFGQLIGYLVTLANFVGIIILLAIIVVVVAVLYRFFGPLGGGTYGGGM